jgi:predicted DNA-binding transcriptional regulator
MKLTQLTAEQRTIYVGLLTELQKDELIGQLYAPDSYYNPIQDLSENWVISIEEIEQTVTPEFLWVKDLDLIPYEPKPTPPPFEA